MPQWPAVPLFPTKWWGELSGGRPHSHLAVSIPCFSISMAAIKIFFNKINWEKDFTVVNKKGIPTV